MLFTQSVLRRGISTAVAACLGACTPAYTVSDPGERGEIVGIVEESPGVATSACRIVVEGMSASARCAADGTFHLRSVPRGARSLIVVREGRPLRVSRRTPIGVRANDVTSAGVVGLLPSGSVAGRLSYATPMMSADFSSALVTVRGLPIVASVHSSGAFVLPEIPAGSRTIVAWASLGAGAATVDVPAQLLPNVSVSLSGMGTGKIRGTVRFVDSRTEAPVRLRAVPQLLGTITEVVADGASHSFEIDAPAGLYWLDATAMGFTAGQIPLVTVLPGGVEDVGEIALSSTASDGDVDGDRIANALDTDLDGDGVINAMDALPNNGWESVDTDRDGLGDLWDPDPMGTGRLPAPTTFTDADMDGRYDNTGEDNCVGIANRDQADRDMDGVGDVCDNCPATPNREQRDTNRNMVGDACDLACTTSAQCPPGQLCDGSHCVECVNSTHCPNTVCVSGRCLPCDATNRCAAGAICASGRCVQCVDDTQCSAGTICQAGACRPLCTTNMDCGAGRTCRAGRCVQCTTTPECPMGFYCTANGACRVECTSNSDCVAGSERCETTSRRCVSSCEASRMCATNERCDSTMLCRLACDGPGDCRGGDRCDAMQHVCLPECDATRPCAMGAECRAGSCVSTNIACTSDAGCASPDQRCQLGRCTARPAPDATGMRVCATPCDCKMGELCQLDAGMGATTRHCVADPYGVPSWFVEASATAAGTGTSPSSTVRTIQAALTNVMPGQTIAVAAGTFSSVAPIALTRQRVKVAGSYIACGTTRWIRDPSASSTVLNGSGPTVFTATGADRLPLQGLAVAGFDFRMPVQAAGDSSFVSLTLVDGARVEACRFSPPANTMGVSRAVFADRTLGLVVADTVTVSPGAARTSDFELFRFTNSGVTFERNATPRMDGRTFAAVSSTGNVGALTIANNTLTESTSDCAITASHSTLLIGACRAPLVIRDNSRIGAIANGGAAAASVSNAILVDRCPDVTIENNAIAGGAVLAFAGETSAQLISVNAEGGTATLRRNQVRGFDPSTTTGHNVIGVLLQGAGDYDLAENDIQPGLPSSVGSNKVTGLEAGGPRLAISRLRLSRGTVAGATSADTDTSIGVYLRGATSATISEARVLGGRSRLNSTGIQSDIPARVERCDVDGGQSAANAIGLNLNDLPIGAEWTVVNSVIAGGSGRASSAALTMSNFGTFTAIASALHAGDETLGNSVTFDKGLSAAVSLQSCILTPGQASGVFWNRFGNIICNDCVAYADTGTLDTAATRWASIASSGMNNRVATTPCYDRAARALRAGSACIDGGPATLTVDGAPLSVDFAGRMRPMGARYDVGPFEGTGP